jgi:hypothetical protein
VKDVGLLTERKPKKNMTIGAVFRWLETTRALIFCCELSHRFELDHICRGVFDAVNVGPRVQSPPGGVVIEASADAKLILVAGQPLKQPIVQYGPFVMNTKEEIYQALADFRDGRLGERA